VYFGAAGGASSDNLKTSFVQLSLTRVEFGSNGFSILRSLRTRIISSGRDCHDWVIKLIIKLLVVLYISSLYSISRVFG
jgi:hypothetical protein